LSTLLVVPSPEEPTDGRTVTVLDLFDVEGMKVNSVEVEFPSQEVGVVELEPFIAGLKVEGGVHHGHLVVNSPPGTRHLMRFGLPTGAAVLRDPFLVRARESLFLPIGLGARREHLLALVNAGGDSAQVTIRLFFANRSPEWTVSVPASGVRLVPLEDELLAGSEEKGWEKGSVQGYLRFTPKHQSTVTCTVVERHVGETVDQDVYRCLVSW
jgi:hypothetical protein